MVPCAAKFSSYMIEIGSVLHETYRIEAHLGRGGMGDVFRATHLRIPRAYAIKVLRHNADDLETAFARFRREAEISSRMGHPNIVEVHDYNRTTDGCAYYVMEYLEGEDLGAHLKHAAPLPLDRALAILHAVGCALTASHAAGVVHRDLKPANIFLCQKGDREIVKVLDFGISKIQGSGELNTQSDVLLGTPSYMSPEQARGKANKVDGRSDQFALAAILYEMLSGRRAFGERDEPPFATLYRIVNQEALPLFEAPKPVAAVIAKALAKEPEGRYANMAAFVDALAQAAATTNAAPVGPPGARRSIGWWTACGLFAFAVGLVAITRKAQRAAPAPAPIRQPVRAQAPRLPDAPPPAAPASQPNDRVELPVSISPTNARVIVTRYDGTQDVVGGPWAPTDQHALRWKAEQRPRRLRVEAAGYRAGNLDVPDGNGVLAPVHLKLVRLHAESTPPALHPELSYPWK